MSHMDDIIRGFEIISDPTSAEFTAVAHEIGRRIVDQVARIDPAKALQIGLLVYRIVKMHEAQNSFSAQMFHVIDRAQPDGHPLTSVAYAIGGMIDNNKAAFIADTARNARVAMSKIADPPPTDSEIGEKLEELAELGLEVIIVGRTTPTEKNEVETTSPLHVV